MEGATISQKTLIGKDKADQSKFWIHRFDKDLMKQLDDERILGAEKKGSVILNKLNDDDRIIIFSTLEVNGHKKICFLAYTMVDEIFENDEPLYDYYFSPKKLRLKGIKYFTEPIMAIDISDELKFIEDKKKSASYFKSEYREISEKDFKNIIRKTSLTKEYPAYFERVSYSMDDFLLNAIKTLYVIIKQTEQRNQFEIKTFLKLLQKFLKEYDIPKSAGEIEDFYARNVWKLGFKHNPSRDPDKFVFLYNRSGKKRNFSYISLE